MGKNFPHGRINYDRNQNVDIQTAASDSEEKICDDQTSFLNQ